jgi:hypothetical protein
VGKHTRFRNVLLKFQNNKALQQDMKTPHIHDLKWYQAHCNGDWEHNRRIHLGTLDNSGWSLTVNLQDTELEDRNFQEVETERSKDEWIHCTVKESHFEGKCGSGNLPEVLQLFCDWAENCEVKPKQVSSEKEKLCFSYDPFPLQIIMLNLVRDLRQSSKKSRERNIMTTLLKGLLARI